MNRASESEGREDTCESLGAEVRIGGGIVIGLSVGDEGVSVAIGR